MDARNSYQATLQRRPRKMTQSGSRLMQRRGNSGSLNGDQVASNSVHDGLEHGDAFVSFKGDVENEATDAGNGHGDDDGRPTVE